MKQLFFIFLLFCAATQTIQATVHYVKPTTTWVTVVTYELPALTAPANQNLNVNANTCAADYTIPDPISGNGIDFTWGYTLSGTTNGSASGFSDGTNSGVISFDKGVTTVVLIGYDDLGNVNSTQTFTVTVSDNQAPTITNCPADQFLSTDFNNCEASYTISAPPLSDNCAGPYTWEASFGGNSNGNPSNFSGIADGASSSAITFYEGTTTVTLNAIDAAGNVSTGCSFTVGVIDDTPPIITCASSVMINTTPGLCTGTTTLGVPFVSDNCSVGIPTDDAPATYPIGSTIVTWTVSDVSGNTEICTQTITVADNEIPTITDCPSNQIINTIVGTCAANYTIPAPTLTDNCTGTLIWNVTFSGNPNGNPSNLTEMSDGSPSPVISFKKGLTTVILNVVDAEGNASLDCSFTVNVVNTSTPVTAFNSYTWAANGTTYTASGTYLNITTGSGGCQDTSMLVLTINAAPLPITLANFTAKKVNSTIQLAWETKTEANVSHFEIEKSVDGVNFVFVGKKVAKGTTSIRQVYDLTDFIPAQSNNYYRLKTVDRDGKIEYSKVISVFFDKSFTVTIYPNPVQMDINVFTIAEEKMEVIYTIFDVTGKVLMNAPLLLNKNKDMNTIDLTNLQPGIYNIRFENANHDLLSVQRFVKMN